MREQNMTVRLAAFGVASVLIAAACGGDDGNATDEATTTEAAATTDDSMTEAAAADDSMTEDAAAAGDDITIPVWIAFEDHRLDWAQDVAADFNEQVDGYNVEVTGFADYNAAFDATLQAINSGEPPAVVHFFEAATQEARDAITANGDPVFADLETIIDGRTEVAGVPVVLDDVVSAAATYYQLDGSYTSMPWNTSSAIMFVNRSMLDAAGVEGTPATWDELEAACETFMSSANATDGCVTWPNHSWFVEQQIALSNELLANNDNGRSARADEVFINSNAMVNYITWWKDMKTSGYYTYTGAQNDWGGPYDLFAAQQVPFLLYSSSDTATLTQEGVDGGFEVEAAFLPGPGVDGGGALIGGATNWVINDLDEAAQDGAIAWVNFLSNPENAASWHQTTGYIPISSAAITLLQGEGYFDANPNQSIASDQLAASPNTPATTGALIGNFVAIRDVITGAIEDILVNDLDPATRLADAQRDSQALLDEYNLLFAEG